MAEVPSDRSEQLDMFTISAQRLGSGTLSRHFLARHNVTGEKV
jgi:hypothetical protein